MEVGGAPTGQDTHCSTQSGICTCSMGMSCSRSSKLCTYWILLMNLTLAGEEGGTRLKASPWGGDSESEGAMAAYSRMPQHTHPNLPLSPCQTSPPAPGVGTEQNLGSLPAREGS